MDLVKGLTEVSIQNIEPVSIVISSVIFSKAAKGIIFALDEASGGFRKHSLRPNS